MFYAAAVLNTNTFERLQKQMAHKFAHLRQKSLFQGFHNKGGGYFCTPVLYELGPYYHFV